MASTAVTEARDGKAARPFDVRTVLAFFAIYVLWGTSFLGIRIAVQEVPPLFAAGTRFFVAGVVLYGFMRFRGQPGPTRSQWRSLAIIGLLMFVAEYLVRRRVLPQVQRSGLIATLRVYFADSP